jgi:small subunit ribosomal protein S1
MDVWVRRVQEGPYRTDHGPAPGPRMEGNRTGHGRKGKVVRLEPYGAFVDIGAERPGMVHVSELAHGYVKTPSEIVKEGDEVEAKVLDVNRKKKQIKLSMKALEPEIEEFKPAKREEQESRQARSQEERMEVMSRKKPRNPS